MFHEEDQDLIVFEGVLSDGEVENLRTAVASTPNGEEVRRKRGVYGVRNLLEICPAVEDLCAAGEHSSNRSAQLKGDNGTTKQYAGWHPLFTADRNLASIVHFGGPMIVQPLRYKSISLIATKPELHLRFATPGSDRTSFASLAYEAVPASHLAPLSAVFAASWNARRTSLASELGKFTRWTIRM